MNTESAEERLARIEATLPHLARKADIERLRAEHQADYRRFIQWTVAILLMAAGVTVSLVLAIEKIVSALEG